MMFKTLFCKVKNVKMVTFIDPLKDIRTVCDRHKLIQPLLFRLSTFFLTAYNSWFLIICAILSLIPPAS